MDPRLRPYLLAGAILVLDRLTKSVIERSVAYYDVIPVIPGFFQIVHTENQGIAFGLFNDGASAASRIILVVFSLIILGFIAGLLWHYNKLIEAEHWTLRYGLGCILGGALGNVYDRIAHGPVTDFLDFFYGHWHFPVFNAADSAITVGAGLLLINMWAPKRPQPAQVQSDPPAAAG
jgi:signal peptidase II